MIRTKEELKSQASQRGLKKWIIHNCSMCGYPCGFIFRDDGVLYDSGCGCADYIDTRQSSWEEVEQTYNRNQPENNPAISQNYLDRTNEVWLFSNPQ